jgi:predicted lipoprotein
VKLRSCALVAVVSLVLLTACNDNDANAARGDVLRNLSHEVITPAYTRLGQSTEQLAQTTAALCDAPSAEARRAAQDAWEQAWSAWNRTRAFRFGPIVEADAAADIAFMVDTDKVDELLDAPGQEGEPLTPEALEAKGADVRGLGAVEHLLFTGDALDPAACAYAAAAAELVADSAGGVADAWAEPSDDAPAFRDQLAEPGAGGRYLNAQAAVGDLVNGISMALTDAARELANAEAAPPGGRETVGTHGGSRVRDALWSVRAGYFGSTDGTDGDGLSDLVADVSETADERVRDLLDQAEQQVSTFPDSLDDADADTLTDAYDAVRNAGTIVRAEVASELGVTISLGDADGDS